MSGFLLLGLLYLAYQAIGCDPLYANDPTAAGYDSGSTLGALTPLLPKGVTGDDTLPVPAWDFGACAAPR